MDSGLICEDTLVYSFHRHDKGIAEWWTCWHYNLSKLFTGFKVCRTHNTFDLSVTPKRPSKALFSFSELVCYTKSHLIHFYTCQILQTPNTCRCSYSPTDIRNIFQLRSETKTLSWLNLMRIRLLRHLNRCCYSWFWWYMIIIEIWPSDPYIL